MKNISQRTAAIGLVVGILAIPGLVVASTAVLNRDEPASDQTRDAAVAQVARAVIGESTTTIVAVPDVAAPPPAEPDFATACGPEGALLVEREAAGSITDLEQAALDALRPICANAGFALADAPAPPPVVIVETVVSQPASTGTTPPPAEGGSDDRFDDDHDEDERDEDEHDEKDHEDDEDDD